MKSIAKLPALVAAFLILFAGSALAETVYVKGVMKITMRTGPGVGHKIVSMVKSGDSLEIMEKNEDWSHVRSSNGREGWVLTRYVTAEVPVVLLVDGLKKKNTELTDLVARLKTENAELSGTRTKLRNLEKSYTLLKKESADFLALEKKYEKATKGFQEQQEHIAALEKTLGNEDIKWFLSGAGVLVAGILLGMSAKKKKRSSLL
ncbi:MAG: TIGR04211 family SH3 domain-containing protein [Desulfobacteraceae bacterium]|nr:TIGR04211 family SH3 domain-containing protein [Desulfobacteraceae bacterium]